MNAAMDNAVPLCNIRPGEHAYICSLNFGGSMRRRLLDIGLINNTLVECIGVSPGGGMAAYMIRGAVIALRLKDCRNIFVRI